jgi:protein-tyrosine phosphatase
MATDTNASPVIPERRRSVVVDGCYNVRDLGGLPGAETTSTMWGHLFRADGPDDLTEAGRSAVKALGVATVVDLRRPDERGSTQFLDVVVSLPIEDAPGDLSPAALGTYNDLGRRYHDMALGAPTAVATLFDVLAERGGRPILIHCAAGKDRTGIMVALILSALGVDDASIAWEYALSHAPVTTRRSAILERDPQAYAKYGSLSAVIFGAVAETMTAFLERVTTVHGSTESFLRDCGVTTGTLARVRGHFVASAT